MNKNFFVGCLIGSIIFCSNVLNAQEPLKEPISNKESVKDSAFQPKTQKFLNQKVQNQGFNNAILAGGIGAVGGAGQGQGALGGLGGGLGGAGLLGGNAGLGIGGGFGRFGKKTVQDTKLTGTKGDIKEIEDKSNRIYAFKSNLFLWNLGLSIDQLNMVGKMADTSSKPKASVRLKWVGVDESQKEDIKFFKSPEEYMDLLKKAERAFKNDFKRTYRNRYSEDNNWDELYEIIERLDLDDLTNISCDFKYAITPNAREQAKIFLELLDIDQIKALISEDYNYESSKDILDNLIDSLAEDVEWKVEREKALENILASLGLDIKNEAVIKNQLNQLLDEIEALRKKNSKEDVDISLPKRKEFLERVIKLTQTNQKKMVIIQNRVERKLAYELSNPEFENVIKKHLFLSKTSTSKFSSPSLNELTKGIKTISSPGTPGRITVFGDDAFAVVVGKVDENSVQAAVAAGTLGKGRVVAFSHEAYLSNLESVGEGDTVGFLKNSIHWASGGKQSPKIVILGQESLIKVLELVGFKAEKADLQKLTTDQVLIAQENFVEEKDVESISKFIKSGGGFITATTGWGWKQLHPGKDLKTDHAANRILNLAGLAFADGYLADTSTTDDGFLVTSELPLMTNAAQALKTLIAVSKENKDFLSIDDASLIAFSLGEVVNNLDRKNNAIVNLILAIVKSMPLKVSKEYPEMDALWELVQEK